MKYLLDQGLARSTVEHLRQLGIESLHVGELGLSAASDTEILNEGEKLGAIIVTLDSDFHALLALSNAVSPSVIRIRLEGLKGQDVARLIHQVSSLISDDLAAGAAVTVSDRRLAIRRLPLNPSSSKSKPGESDANDQFLHG
jgi:predicted nuclease of predicted toxin-antitoxin system